MQQTFKAFIIIATRAPTQYKLFMGSQLTLRNVCDTYMTLPDPIRKAGMRL